MAQPKPDIIDTPLRVRVRSKRACHSCRKRKRKCNGSQPCAECLGYGYECSFEAHSPKTSSSHIRKRQLDRLFRSPDQATESSNDFSPVGIGDENDGAAASESIRLQQRTSMSCTDLPMELQERSVFEPYKSRFMGASSAVAFARGVGVDLGMISPPRLHSYAWNVGIRSERLSLTSTRLRQLLSFEDSQPYIEVYFDAVNPLYGIVSKDSFAQRCTSFWNIHLAGTAFEATIFEAVICGIISLGSFFSNGNTCAIESELVEHSKLLLESSISQPPALVTMDHVTASILRSLYLRLTTRPHLSWLASCTTMHLAEATGLHQEMDTIQSAIDDTRPLAIKEADSRRRIFWVAWSFNQFLSAEYGRSPVYLDNVRCYKPVAQAYDFTTDLIALAGVLPLNSPQSNDSSKAAESEAALIKLSHLPDRVSALTLLKADVCLILCRRLWAKNYKMSSDQIDTVLSIFQRGFTHAQILSKQHHPWWNVLSVPFQSLCMLLSISSAKTIEMLPEAMQTLTIVAQTYDTHLTREALNIARRLIARSAERRREDLVMLDGLCNSYDEPNIQLTENDLNGYTTISLPGGLPGDDIDWTEFFCTKFP
jgi:hypothetical protein